MRYTYLLINLFSVLIPFIFSFHPRIRFSKHFKAFFFSNIITAIIFIAWDVLFTYKGVWGFNEKYLTGPKLFNIPLEEVLFFICIPFACIFTYHSLNRFFKLKWSERSETVFTIALIVILAVLGIINLDRSYTATTFISTGILLAILKFIFRIDWLSKFYSSYLILLIPFLIVNGLLTGTGLQEPVVWYDNMENLGIRILTIPVEDIFYGMELIMLNLFFYHGLKSTLSAKSSNYINYF